MLIKHSKGKRLRNVCVCGGGTEGVVKVDAEVYGVGVGGSQERHLELQKTGGQGRRLRLPLLPGEEQSKV